MAEVEAAFDGVGLDIEPVEPYRIVFLEPVGDDNFSVSVFDDAEEASWAYDELKRQRRSITESVESIGARTSLDLLPSDTLLRRANVLVHSDEEVSREVRSKMEKALGRLDES